MKIIDNDQLGWRGWDGNRWQYGELIERGMETEGVIYGVKKNPSGPDLNQYKYFYLKPAGEKSLIYIPYPETLGRSTGIKDKYGQVIYEKDIIWQKEENENGHFKIVLWDPFAENFKAWYSLKEITLEDERNGLDLITGQGISIYGNEISEPKLFRLIMGSDQLETPIIDQEKEQPKEVGRLA